MDIVESLQAKIDAGEEITFEEFEQLRALRERLDDLEDQLNDDQLPKSLERSTGAGVAIVVGHTEKRQGANGVEPIGEPEYPWNNDLAQMVKQRCDAEGIESRIFYRNVGGINGAYRRVTKWGASCVVELHFNAFNGRVFGTETLYDEDTNSGSRAWASLLQQEMVSLYQRTGSGDRGLKERDPGDRGYRSVSSANIPSALIEPFFGDNPDEAVLAEQKKDGLADAITNAIRAQVATS